MTIFKRIAAVLMLALVSVLLVTGANAAAMPTAAQVQNDAEHLPNLAWGAVDFSIILGDEECAPDGYVQVPIYAFATTGDLRFVKVTVEYDHQAYTFEGFSNAASGGYFDTNDDLPFGVSHEDMTENAIVMWSGGNWGTGGLMGYANFTALDEWSAYTAALRFDDYCGAGVSHVELLAYDTESPYGLIGAAVNMCNEYDELTALDGSITIVPAKVRTGPVAVQSRTWEQVKKLYR